MKIITCLGPGQAKPGEWAYGVGFNLGILLAKGGAEVHIGAYDGVSEAVAYGARQAGGRSVGFSLYAPAAPNPYLREVVDCDLLAQEVRELKNQPHLDWLLQLGYLLSADGFVVVAGDGIETLAQLAAALLFNVTVWPKREGKTKRIAIIAKGRTQRLNEWNTAMLGMLTQWGALPERHEEYLQVFYNPHDAAAWALGE